MIGASAPILELLQLGLVVKFEGSLRMTAARLKPEVTSGGEGEGGASGCLNSR